jgi:SPOR domain
MARPAPPQASAPSAETAPVGATPTALPTAAALTAPATAPIASAGALPATPARLEQAAEPAAAPPIASAPTKTGGMRLQLGSVRSAGMARAEWDRIKRANADLLGNFSAVAVRTDLGDKGVYYRIQTVPVGDAAHADRICGELKQRHLGCFTVR